MDQETINELLEAAKPAVLESLKKELSGSISYTAKQECLNQVREHTKEWVSENIIPEITTALIESKEGMVSIGIELAPKIVEAITESMLEGMKEKMEKSWERKKIMSALFE